MTQNQNRKVIIIGGGIIGLSAALKAREAGHDVTIWSLEGTDGHANTSESAYAMWTPVGFDPQVLSMCMDTRDELTALAADAASGIELRTAIVLHDEKKPAPWFANIRGFRYATRTELTDEYAEGVVVEDSPVIDPSTYLPYLRARVLAAGVVIEKHEVTSFADIPAQFDTIINCSSLGSQALTGDTSIAPVRVQVVRVPRTGNESITKCYTDDDGPNKRCCVVPHKNYITVGAIFDDVLDSIEPDLTLVQDILDRAKRVVPGLRASVEDVIEVRRALRPERPNIWAPWLEKTTTEDGRTLIHCTGFNGMGYLLSLGAANVVASYLA